jgi:hypothetical protein
VDAVMLRRLGVGALTLLIAGNALAEPAYKWAPPFKTVTSSDQLSAAEKLIGAAGRHCLSVMRVDVYDSTHFQAACTSKEYYAIVFGNGSAKVIPWLDAIRDSDLLSMPPSEIGVAKGAASVAAQTNQTASAAYAANRVDEKSCIIIPGRIVFRPSVVAIVLLGHDGEGFTTHLQTQNVPILSEDDNFWYGLPQKAVTCSSTVYGQEDDCIRSTPGLAVEKESMKVWMYDPGQVTPDGDPKLMKMKVDMDVKPSIGRC